MMLDFTVPENSSVIVRDIRVKGFTLDWTDIPGESYEYAIAASHDGHIENYGAAVENNKIVLHFTPANMLNGTYKITGMLPGKEYEIKIFVQAKNMNPSEYLHTKAVLPYIDEAEIANVTINGHKSIYDKTDDSFSYYYLTGLEDDNGIFTFTYELMRGCSLYINGEKFESKEVKLTPYEPLEITAVNDRTQAARDYTVYAGGMNNGIPIVIVNTVNNRQINSQSRAVSAHMKIIDCKDNPLGIGLYDGEIEIRGRGNSSWGAPKKGYNFDIENKTQIFDMAPSRHWLFIASYPDKSIMRNYIAYEFYRDLGAEFAPKMRFVDLILNGKYAGTYFIGERVKVEKGRIDFPKITADTTDEYELTGTYLLEINYHGRLRGGEMVHPQKAVDKECSV